MRHVLVVLALVGCKGNSEPIDAAAIVGDWQVWCYTSTDTAECAGKESAGLHKRFVAGGELVVTRPGEAPDSDQATWRLEKDRLFLEVRGGAIKLTEQYDARIEDDRLVLWDPAARRGQVLGRIK